MAIFTSYVKLPEGKTMRSAKGSLDHQSLGLNQHWDIIIKHRGFTNRSWTPDSSRNEGPSGPPISATICINGEHDALCDETDWLMSIKIRRSHGFFWEKLSPKVDLKKRLAKTRSFGQFCWSTSELRSFQDPNQIMKA